MQPQFAAERAQLMDRRRRNTSSHSVRLESRTMTDKQIKRAVEASIDELKAEKPPLIFAKVHERTTAQPLAVHIGQHFEGRNVDTGRPAQRALLAFDRKV